MTAQIIRLADRRLLPVARCDQDDLPGSAVARLAELREHVNSFRFSGSVEQLQPEERLILAGELRFVGGYLSYLADEVAGDGDAPKRATR